MNAATATFPWALKGLALLLHYPDAALQVHAPEIAATLAGRPELDAGDRAALERHIARIGETDLLELQAEYVATFDHSKKVSLYLFEHVYGESRDRGQAMVELVNAYREQGLVIDGQLLPDYLPLFLEFCAGLPEAEARDWLADTAHVLQAIHVRLVNRESPHALPLRLLLRLLGEDPAPAELVASLREETRDDTRAALDQIWMEAPVTFGPEPQAGGCGQAQPQIRPVVWRDPRSDADPGPH